MKTTLLIGLLFLNVATTFSQSDSTELGKFNFGINVNLNETHIKSYLFDNFITGDASTRHYGFNFMVYLNLKKNWYTGLGGGINIDHYYNSNRFTKTQVVSSPINTHQHFIETMVNNLTLDYKLKVDDEKCWRTLYDGDFDRENYFLTLNKIQTLGIPIVFGRTTGQKRKRQYLGRLKFYSQITIQPNIIIAKKIDVGEGGHFGFRGRITELCSGPGTASGQRVHTWMELLEYEVSVNDYNIRDSRIDAKIELGILERFKRVYYKVGVFYGESLTPFTTIQEKDYYGQIAGFKLEFGVLRFKKLESGALL